jgi:myo-inositol catabolism protein IolS
MNRATRQIGGSGIRVSPLAMGCWAYGGGSYWGEQSQGEVNRIVASALDQGLNMFDTAEMYNAGASEESLGIALGARRREAVVCSKVSPDHTYRNEIVKHCEDSLRRLKTDYLDVYMIHWPLNTRSIAHFTKDERKVASPPPIEEAMEGMRRLRDGGKIRAIGVSNFGAGQLREALATGVSIDVNEITYNILSRAIEESILPFCIENDISVVGSMALQQGLLTGTFKTFDDVPPNQAHSRHFSQERGKDASRHGGAGHEDLLFTTISALSEIARREKMPLARLAIAWAIAKPGITAMLVGSRDLDQLQQNIRALEVTLPDAVIREIDGVSDPLLKELGSSPDYYESDENCRIW